MYTYLHKDIFENPQFYIEGASASDVRQGFNGDCWFLSALCAISNKKNLIDRICVARDEKVGVYGFVFHRDGEWFHTVVDDKLYLTAADWWESHDDEKRIFENINRQEAEMKYRETFQKGSKALYFAQCREENETWLPLLEKAFAKAHGDYSAIDGGFTGEAIEDLTGGVTTELFATDILDKDQFWNEEIKKVNQHFLFSCATGTFDKWQESDTASQTGARAGIIRMHAYSIMDAVERKGQRLLKIRNPWGSDEWRGAWSDGSEQWTAEWMKELDHTFGDDGMFWISYEDFLEKYSTFERTRLFDDTWTITQQWTTLDVPWSADYNDTKFTVTITKQSPVVIILSQLDDRYFKGFEGQYTFQLHFRLDKDGEDDYIVRSHGNYSMRRSVSTDLELEPGKYSVLMRLTARRFSNNATVEKVVREKFRERQNKLIQIGLSYDLAHAKGEIVENEEEKELRLKLEEKEKATDRKKKRQEFRTTQKNKWEANKRMKAREKRHAKKREEYQKRKAEKQVAVQQPEDGAQGSSVLAEGATVAVGIEADVEKQAAAGAEADKSGETNVNIASMPPPPAENQAVEPTTNAETNGNPIQESTSKTKESNLDSQEKTAQSKDESTKAEQFEQDLQALPLITVDGDASAPIQLDATLAPPSVPGSIAGADDDYLYESDASFQSSIDSVLDLAEDPAASGQELAADGQDVNDEDSDAEFADDPWNAVCVVGLRVYSKDEGCCIKVVRPRPQQAEGLEIDDVSKGVSQEKEDGKGIPDREVKAEVKTGIND